MPTHCYQNCHCPDCRHKLDDVATTSATCPMCNKPLDPHRVWSTRVYPGVLILPHWVAAFGWPLLFILAGVGSGAYTWFYLGYIRISLSATLIAIGVVHALVKLANADD